MKYYDWLGEWLDCFVKPATKERTYSKYRGQIHNYISPRLGGLELDDLTAQVLQRFTVELSEEGLASNTVNGIVSVIKSSLRRAVMLGLTNVQCTDAIVRPKAHEKQVECFTKDEQRKIEKYITAREKYVTERKKDKLFGILLTLYTGLRVGELLALTWEDIDFAKGILTVSKSCHDEWENGEYKKAIDTPKTENAYRVVPIPKPLLQRLKELKKHGAGDYVVGGKTDQGAPVRSYQRTFELLLKRLGLPHRGFHALRHTFATRALEVGMDVKTLAELLGHSNPTITLKRYAHSLLEHKTEMMNRLGKLLLP